MKNEALDLLKVLVSIPSFASEAAMAKFLVDFFRKELPGFSLNKFRFAKGRSNLLFSDNENISLLFACHTDTVLPSEEGQLNPKTSGNKIYGLGAKDMKGGIVSLLLALKFASHGGIGALFYGDEEKTQMGIKSAAIFSKKLFPIKPKLIIAPESRFDLGVGARGMVVMNLEVKGERAHSARPYLGRDAIKGMFLITNLLENKLNQRKSVLGSTSVTIASLEGGLLQPDGKIASHAGTIPDIARGVISIRNANVGLDGTKIVDLIKKFAGKLGLQISAEVLEDYPARMTDPRVVNKIKKIIKSVTGKEVKMGNPKIAGFNDVALLGKSLGCPVINFGPDGGNNHTAGEWVDIESVVRTANVFKAVIEGFNHGKQ